MSFDHRGPLPFRPPLPQVAVHVTYTHPGVHDLVRASLDRSPLYTGKIRARGPRYCPSFEDKVVRFADRDRHLLHLEPMGNRHPWIYVNGLSTSLPAEIQEEIVRAIPGLERARIARFGYAVEYDFVPPTQLRPNLGVPGAAGLFLAGQICGTTGYEEAAGLGLVAGANAALFARGDDPWIPDRFSSYLGVMVDDLTTIGVLEPYRMFTSRAEFRLSMSPDSADRRLTPVGAALGLVSGRATERCNARWERIELARSLLDGTGSLRGPRAPTPADRIRRGEAHAVVLAEELPGDLALHDDERETLAALLRYRGYLEREQREVERLREAERCRVPDGFLYDGISGLSNEVRERLTEVAPVSLGQAARIPGVTPAAVALLAVAIASARRPDP
jgi:tRNA uridine 5-carboxymethylaminomethyl modification enzyme